MKQIHYFNAIIILWLFSCNPQKKPIEPKIADVALTPPMGWNSYDCFGATVTEEEVKANAQIMAVHLKDAGWEYIVIDYLWFYPFPGAMHAPNQLEDFTPNFRLDNMGRLLPALDRFPSSKGSAGFKPLADYVHNLGLKFGIHVMRGVPREAVAKKLPVGSGNITADMIPIGMLAHRGPEGKPAHRSLFTWEEKKTLFSLWAIFRSPLMYGGDLTLVERPEMEMLQNKALLAVNQNSKNNRQLFRKDDKVAWTADVPSANDKYIALFNLGETESEIEVNFADLGIESECRVTDLWSGHDLGTHSHIFKQSIVPHGSGLYKFIVKD